MRKALDKTGRYYFKGECPAADWVSVTAAPEYDEKHGYGFEPNDYNGCLIFSIRAAEGNYRVRVVLGDEEAETATNLWSETRRLMRLAALTRPGERERCEFIVNVRNPLLCPPASNAPGGRRVLLNEHERFLLRWDDKLSIGISGRKPGLLYIEIEKAPGLPTVFLAGDSTVADQPQFPYASWGQMLPAFLKPAVAVANHAESGETLKSFLTELRLAKILELGKPGDYLFIQFGHNDQKQQWPQTYVEAGSTYKAYFRAYIAEARLRGMHPVLVTSPERLTFDAQARILPSHGSYPDALRALAVEQELPLIDLERMSRAFYEALGPGESPKAFAPGDTTHYSGYGAYELARCIVLGIKQAGLPLADNIIERYGAFDPSAPDLPSSFPPEMLDNPLG